jgi:phosphoesterase RecJ-like protein
LQLGWTLNPTARNMLVSSIMSDTLGLTTESATSRTIHIVGELVGQGVSIAELEQKRRLMMRKSPAIIRYKGELLQRIEYFGDNRIAAITIPWEEIVKYSYEYNPSVLVLDDMRSAHDVQVVIAFKLYKDGKITAKIRCNYGAPIAGDLAAHFGGGGHAYASGFKLTDARPLADVKRECMQVAADLLDAIATAK